MAEKLPCFARCGFLIVRISLMRVYPLSPISITNNRFLDILETTCMRVMPPTGNVKEVVDFIGAEESSGSTVELVELVELVALLLLLVVLVVLVVAEEESGVLEFLFLFL